LGALPQAGAATGAIDPVAVENRGGAGRFVIVCDHASNRFPPEFGFLGLDASAREAHIAWDPGALGVSRRLSEMLDAPLVHCTVSRLVIDCNRDPRDPDSIVEMSIASQIRVSGNSGLSEAERRHRIAAVHTPYHRAIEDLIEGRAAAGRETALIAVHSFTPVFGDVRRPWEVALIFDRDRRLADVLIDGLDVEGFNVGVNEPYSPADRVYYTLSRHAEARGLDCAMIEIRNDLIGSDRAETEWAERIAGLLAPALQADQGRVAIG
jgi:predicted N-formylglutamate amidohydrolase